MLQRSWLSVTEWIINDKLSTIVITVPPSGGVTQKLQRKLVEEILENFTSAPCITCSDLSVSYELISVLSLPPFHFSLLCVSPCDWLVILGILPLSHCRSSYFSQLQEFRVRSTVCSDFHTSRTGAGSQRGQAERQPLSGRGEVFTSGRALAWLGWWRVAGGLLGLLSGFAEAHNSGFNRSSERSPPPRFKPPEVVRIWQYFWAAMG